MHNALTFALIKLAHMLFLVLPSFKLVHSVPRSDPNKMKQRHLSLGKVTPKKEKGIASLFYNEENGEVLGRTGKSWVFIIIYYIFYYSLIIGFFTLNYFLFSKTLSESSPQWLLDQSVIGPNPGLTLLPRGIGKEALISVDGGDEKTWIDFYTQLKATVEESNRTQQSLKKCRNGESADTNSACSFQLSQDQMGNCSIQNKFGYPNGNPCFILKLNKLFGWLPVAYGTKEDGKMDRDLLRKEVRETIGLPDDLRMEIFNEMNATTEVSSLKKVWISCNGVEENDKKALGFATTSYHPNRAIPSNYFPYLNQKFYTSPYIMVQFSLPQRSRRIFINIVCRAWARNIQHDALTGEGVTVAKFRLHVN